MRAKNCVVYHKKISVLRPYLHGPANHGTRIGYKDIPVDSAYFFFFFFFSLHMTNGQY